MRLFFGWEPFLWDGVSCTKQSNIHTDTYYPHYIKQGVCHTLWPCHFTLKSILWQKKNNENSNISPCKNIIFKKILRKKNQNPSRNQNSITNLKFQTQAKISSFKNPHIKNRPIIIITQGPIKIPEATILYNESKHNILAMVGKAKKLILDQS